MRQDVDMLNSFNIRLHIFFSLSSSQHIAASASSNDTEGKHAKNQHIQRSISSIIVTKVEPSTKQNQQSRGYDRIRCMMSSQYVIGKSRIKSAQPSHKVVVEGQNNKTYQTSESNTSSNRENFERENKKNRHQDEAYETYRPAWKVNFPVAFAAWIWRIISGTRFLVLDINEALPVLICSPAIDYAVAFETG